MIVNWQTLTMKFKVGESTVTLQGDSSLSRTLVSLKSMLKTIKKAGEGILVELRCVQVTGEGKQTKIPEEISQVLRQFAVVFEKPQGLPPTRACDHAIVPQEGTICLLGSLVLSFLPFPLVPVLSFIFNRTSCNYNICFSSSSLVGGFEVFAGHS